MYVEVIVPLPLNAEFTYSVPDDISPRPVIGSRVVVPFGRRKFYTAIVTSFTPIPPSGYEVKPLICVLDGEGDTVLRSPQLKFWRWISEYYLCPIGDVMRAALPAGLKLESETYMELTSEADLDDVSGFTDPQILIIQALAHHGKLTLGELTRITGLTASPGKAVAPLLERGIVMVSERIVERYRPLRRTLVSLPPEASSTGWRTSAFAMVKGSRRQEMLLLALLQIAAPVEKAELLERSGCSAAILKALETKGLVKVDKVTVNRFAPAVSAGTHPIPDLSEAQTRARDSILSSWIDDRKNITLLRGVTSSGKTEIYIHLIDRMIRSGRQVLFLVPEIALTTQLTDRLRNVFGSAVIVYHSKFTDNERVDIWRRVLDRREPVVVVGARSSVFLPFSRLGLVIVDEEHEPSYKQFDPAPRYNARDTAIVLASMHGARTLLGSASPSVETYYKALTGRYGLVELTERYGGVRLPEIELVDMHKEWLRNRSDSSPLSSAVTAAVESAVASGNQAILFHNRRGFAPLARCKACAHVPKCECCDVSLTYHKRENRLVCHYCGAVYPMPTVCPVCHEPAMEIVGYGTERVEDTVEQTFAGARVLRMDLDTTRNKDGYQEIINTFSAHKADILVGTQMVTKGLDFGAVSLVAVLSADTLINLPDFRSAERAFNMLLQVAGRAGRRDKPGRVMVQTANPSHPLLKFLLAHDYPGFYAAELAERKARLYPPFTRMIFIYLKHRDDSVLQEVSSRYGNRLRELLGERVSGPDKPLVGRIQSLYIRRFMLKIEVEASMAKVKELLLSLFIEMHDNPQMKGTQIYYDVDPA